MYSELTLADIENLNEDYPCRLIVMLYDEAIAALRAAMVAIEGGHIEARCHATARVTEIVSQLYLSLDMEQGGEIAENLGQIYNLVIRQMAQINFTNDAALAEQAIGLLTPLRDSWFGLDERIRGCVEIAENEEREHSDAAIAAAGPMDGGLPA